MQVMTHSRRRALQHVPALAAMGMVCAATMHPQALDPVHVARKTESAMHHMAMTRHQKQLLQWPTATHALCYSCPVLAKVSGRGKPF